MPAAENKDIVLIHGLMGGSFLDLLKERQGSNVYLLEGRPKLRSANALSRAFNKRKITPTLIADSMAGFLFKRNLVKEVWLAYQSSDSEGAMCEIGALILGVLGKRHQVPVYLYPAAQKNRLMGKQADILNFNGVRVAPKGVKGYVPLAEWVPARYISKVYSNGSSN